MATTFTYSITGTLRNDDEVQSLMAQSVAVTVGDTYKTDTVTVTFAAPVTLDLGDVATPLIGYFYNKDATNFLEVRDDTDVLASIPAGKTAIIPLDSGVVLKAQADTGDCSMYYAIYDTP